MEQNSKIINTKININQLKENSVEEVLNNFCYVEKTNEIIINYKYFKILNKMIDQTSILNYLIIIVESVLKKYDLFTVHVYIERLTILEIEKNKLFIQSMCIILKEKFQDKLDFCYIHDVSFIFKQIYSFLSLLIDKKTLSKIKLKQ
jgi:hypothetical protein